MLRDKTILILSPQAWGSMFLSKHHYAIELAKRGNLVYFLNPPNTDVTLAKATFRTEDPEGVSNLKIIHHRLSFPYALKFRFIFIFHYLMRAHIRKLMDFLPPIDIVWSFDLGNIYPFKLFPVSALKIFQPVDEFNGAANPGVVGIGAKFIFSVTEEIISKFKDVQVPKYCIGHGVSETFFSINSNVRKNGKVKAGISGNLVRLDIDREILLQIVQENASVEFNFWGSYKLNDSNIGGADDSNTRKFIDQLQSYDNVILHGVKSQSALARDLHSMDIFLICYDVQKDQSRGTNYHKVLEYLSTGRVVVSNNITAYNENPDLVTMVSERNSNQALPSLFKKTLAELDRANSREAMMARINFARQHTYSFQLEKIEKIIYGG